MCKNGYILQAKELSKNFGALKAVNQVNLEIGKGIHSIIGPNGAGKTTLFNLLTGFLQPSTGKIFFLGKDITGLPPYEISRLGIARSFQITSIFPELSVFENVRISAQSRSRSSANFLNSFKGLEDANQNAERILKDLGLLEFRDAKAKNLSYGLQRSLDIAISLAIRPKLILLDEPTSGMDKGDTKKIIKIISVISRQIPVVLIEHNIDVVLSISNRITVLYQGSVLAEGSPIEIQQNEKVQEAYLGGY